LGIPPIAITPEKVENNTPKKEGARGMLPACCLPLWGREGVTLMAAAENYQMIEKRGFQQSGNRAELFNFFVPFPVKKPFFALPLSKKPRGEDTMAPRFFSHE
jgi:hypothetical protein